MGGKKLGRFLLKNQHTQRKILNFETWISSSLQKSEFLKLIILIFHVKKLRKKIKFESKILALFDSTPLIQNSNFNNFL